MYYINYKNQDIKISGLKSAAGDTHHDANNYHRIYLDRGTGEIWTNLYVSSQDWSEYDDSDIIEVCSGYYPQTQKQIMDYVSMAMCEADARDAQYADDTWC